MKRRYFLALTGGGITTLAAVKNLVNEPEYLTDIRTITSYPYALHAKLKLPPNTFGGWKFEGSFVRVLDYGVNILSNDTIDVLAFPEQEFRAFRNNENVNMFAGSTVNTSEDHGVFQSPSSRTDFHFILDGTDREGGASDEEIEMEVSLKATTT